MLNTYKLYESAAGEWGSIQIVAAHSEEEAREIVTWDCHAETERCEKIEGLFYDGEPKVLAYYDSR